LLITWITGRMIGPEFLKKSWNSALFTVHLPILLTLHFIAEVL
jgi:hypothetical protein